MKLVPVTLEDLPLYESIFYDADYMKYLGGPSAPGSAEKYLNAHMRCSASGSGMVYKIVPEAQDWKVEDNEDIKSRGEANGVGTVCMWKSEYKDQPVVEVGWGVKQEFQGRGFATKAVRMFIDLALTEPGKWSNIHTFTHVDNEPSVRMCRTLGFQLLEECEIDYNDKFFRANHYLIAP